MMFCPALRMMSMFMCDPGWRGTSWGSNCSSSFGNLARLMQRLQLSLSFWHSFGRLKATKYFLRPSRIYYIYTAFFIRPNFFFRTYCRIIYFLDYFGLLFLDWEIPKTGQINNELIFIFLDSVFGLGKKSTILGPKNTDFINKFDRHFRKIN